jgi:hypothetical protein
VTTAIALPSDARKLDLDAYSGGKFETREVFDRARRRIDDVDETPMRSHLEVLACVLVLVWRSDDAIDLSLGRKRNGARNSGPGT